MKRAYVSALCALAAVATLPLAAQQARFDDVVRNLRNPDAKVRISAVRLLREAQYPEAIVPMAAVVNDPIDEIQLEAIAAELSFFMVEKVPDRKRVGFLIELRNKGGAAGAFELGPLAVWPKAAPPELIHELFRAVDDEHARVRLEAMHAIGLIGGSAFPADAEPVLVKALDHYDPAVRAAAARVAGRLKVKSTGQALINAINDSNPDVRFAAIRALGQIGEQRAIEALSDQLIYYGKGEGAWASLAALAQIGHPTSVPVFSRYLTHKDPLLRRAAAEGLGRAGDLSEVTALETGAGNDLSRSVRASMAFALQKLGRHYIPRLVDFLSSDDVARQVQGYLLEFGPTIEQELLPRLQEPDEAVRARIAEVLGAIGGEASRAALEGLKGRARDGDVAEAAQQALERIKLRQG
jgi:HEAT repeat protein